MKAPLTTTILLALCLAQTQAQRQTPQPTAPDSLTQSQPQAQADTATASPERSHAALATPDAYALRTSTGQVLALDQYVKTWLKGKATHSLALEAQWDTHHKAAALQAGLSDPGSQGSPTATRPEWLDYAADYNYPTLTLGLRYNFNHGTTMRRDAADWGEDLASKYTSHLGDAITIYGRFERPLWRATHWLCGYYIGTGLGYMTSCYDRDSHIDNELIGTHLNIFFTAGIYLDYRIDSHLTLGAGYDFSHHSNGGLDRPNKGANYLGPFVQLKYAPQADETRLPTRPATGTVNDDWRKRPAYLELSLGLGAKTLNEDWQHTQFLSSPDDPDYRTDHFASYAAMSLQADIMYRYARRWATGAGVDLFYGSYYKRVRYWENQYDTPRKVSPWSLALAVKHEAFLGRLTARMGIGVYLYRHMGTLAKAVEQRYYERVGLFYTLSKRTGMSVGFSVNAHKTKADFTELQLSYPIRL